MVTGTTLALILAALSPIVVAFVTRYMVRADRVAQWERDDAIAAKVELVRTTVEETTFQQGQQLTQIHTLVNSNMTTALEGEMATTKALIVLLKADASQAGSSEIAVYEARVAELEAQLRDRREATENVGERN